MTILTNTTDRKALVKAIAEELHTEARYLRTPTYAYKIGEFTVDRYGNIIGDDFTPLMAFLLRNGYITEDAAAAQAEDADAPTDEEAPVEEPAAEKDTTEEPAAAADSDTDSEEPTSMLSNIDEQTITIPAPDITVEQLRNLTYTLYSRQYILNLMTGGNTICIPLELVEALQEALPATPEDFTRLLNSHKALGLKGFNFEAGQRNPPSGRPSPGCRVASCRRRWRQRGCSPSSSSPRRKPRSTRLTSGCSAWATRARR